MAGEALGWTDSGKGSIGMVSFELKETGTDIQQSANSLESLIE